MFGIYFSFFLGFILFILRGFFILYVYRVSKYVKKEHEWFYEKYRDTPNLMNFVSLKGWSQSTEIEGTTDLFFIKSAKKIRLYNKLTIIAAIFVFIILFISLYLVVYQLRQ